MKGIMFWKADNSSSFAYLQTTLEEFIGGADTYDASGTVQLHTLRLRAAGLLVFQKPAKDKASEPSIFICTPRRLAESEIKQRTDEIVEKCRTQGDCASTVRVAFTQEIEKLLREFQ